MQQLFLKQMFDFLEKQVKEKEISNLIPLIEKLEAFEKKKDLKTLEAFLELYYQKKPSSLEADLIKTFEENTLKRVKTFTKILRGLPRQYQKDDLSKSRIHPHFSSLFFLKKRYLDKTLFFLYESIRIEEKVEVACIIKNKSQQKFFHTFLNSVKDKLKGFDFRPVFISKNSKESDALHITKERKLSLESSSKELISFLYQVPMVLQFFQQQPFLDEFFNEREGKKPHVEVIGGYGEIEKTPFTPISSFQSLGLNFLEMGVMVPEKKVFNKEIGSFYFCDSLSINGVLSYLFFLIELNKGKRDKLKIFFSSKDCLLSVYKTFFSKALERKVACINVILDSKVHKTLDLKKEGVKIDLLFDASFSDEERYASSLEPIGVGSDQGFSYALCYEKGIFMIQEERLSFVKDLIALAKHHIPQNRKALAYFEGMYQMQLHKVVEENGYVTEDFFQAESLDKQEGLFKRLALLYQDPAVSLGLLSLYKVILRKYCANDYLVGLVKRAYLHHKYPILKSMEDKYLLEFLLGEASFLSMVKSFSLGIRSVVEDSNN